jgi:hypothetical protein
VRDDIKGRLSDAVAVLQCHPIGSNDTGMDLTIMNADEISTESAEWEMPDATYWVKKLKQWIALDDQLVYRLIFWNDKGGCGTVENESLKRCTTRIQKVVIYMMLQSWDPFLHVLKTLREGFIGAVSARLANIAATCVFGGQRSVFASEDGIRGIDRYESGQEEFELRIFLLSSMTGTDQYWHGVAEKCFALSSQMRPPTFFLKLTMNLYWPNY